MLYHNLLMNITKNYPYIFRTSISLLNYPKCVKENKAFIYEDYTKEKFYFLNRLIIQWTQKNYTEDNKYNTSLSLFLLIILAFYKMLAN